MGEKDDYDSENSWISDGLPSSSRRRRRGGGRWEVGGGRVERKVKCKRDWRWCQQYQNPDQGREKLRPWMKCRGFRWECHRNCRHWHCRCCHRSSQRSHGHQHTREWLWHSREHWLPRWHRQRQRRDSELRDSKRRCDMMLDFADKTDILKSKRQKL